MLQYFQMNLEQKNILNCYIWVWCVTHGATSTRNEGTGPPTFELEDHEAVGSPKPWAVMNYKAVQNISTRVNVVAHTMLKLIHELQ